MATKNRIQFMLIDYLRKFGQINLLLPDGVSLEIGITEESKNGTIKNENYCWIQTERDDRKTVLDRYSMSVAYDESRLVMDDKGSIKVL